MIGRRRLLLLDLLLVVLLVRYLPSETQALLVAPSLPTPPSFHHKDPHRSVHGFAIIPTASYQSGRSRSSNRNRKTKKRMTAAVAAEGGGERGGTRIATSAAASASLPDDDNNRSSSSNRNSNGNQTQRRRKQNVKFVAPLLEHGYPPAVQKYFRKSTTTSNISDDNNNNSNKRRVLLYLPGFDGTYLAPFIQFPELSTEFDELWCMTISMEDRSTYNELKNNVLQFIDDTIHQQQKQKQSNNDNDNNHNHNNIELYLIGESFGGILASDIALTILQQSGNAINKNNKNNAHDNCCYLKGLTLINPATNYDRSALKIVGPSVYNLPSLLYVPGLLLQLIPLFVDEYSLEQLLLIIQGKALPSIIDTVEKEAYLGRVALALPRSLLKFMPQETFRWRSEQWLDIGCDPATSIGMNDTKLKQFRNEYPHFKTLLIAGEKDKTLPSIAEAERLANLLSLSSSSNNSDTKKNKKNKNTNNQKKKWNRSNEDNDNSTTTNCCIHVVEGAGHASTCGSRLDLTALMRKHFLLHHNRDNSNTNNDNNNNNEGCRTAMKEIAVQGIGPYFGTTPRYDNAKIGLNPILYWSKENYCGYFDDGSGSVENDTSTGTGTSRRTNSFYKIQETRVFFDDADATNTMSTEGIGEEKHEKDDQPRIYKRTIYHSI